MNKSLYIVGLLTLLLLVGAALPVFSHGREKHGQQASHDSTGIVQKNTGRVVQDSVQTAQSISMNHEQQPEEPYQLDVAEALTVHLHNKMIHVPIGLALAAFLLSLLKFKLPELQAGARWLVLLAAIGGVAAYFTGIAQADVFEGVYKGWIVALHQKLGVATIFLIWVWTLFEFLRPLKKYAVVVGVIVVLLILVTGFYGGILAHG
jgi:uncharacterized membrane protein